MADADERPPFFPISADNHSPWVVVTSVVFVVYSILAVVAKIISRIHVNSIAIYDYLIIAATVVAFVQMICMVGASRHGLGQFEAQVLPEDLEEYQKYIYAADILFVIANAFAKASVVFFIRRISPQREIKLACHGLLAVIGMWALGFIFALAFQCDLPKPWNFNGTCTNEWVTHLVLSVFNILTDLALIFIPVAMLWWVQAKSAQKWTVMTLFMTRILVPIFTVPQLVYQDQHFSSEDRTRTQVLPSIFTQIVMNASILTACIPSLKGVIDIYLSGTALINVPEHYRTTLSGSGSQGLRSRVRTALGLSINNSSHGTRNDSTKHGEWPTKQMKSVTGQHSSQVTTNGKKQGVNQVPERSESQRSLTEDAIMRTIDYEIEYEDSQTKGTHSSIEEEVSVKGRRRY